MKITKTTQVADKVLAKLVAILKNDTRNSFPHDTEAVVLPYINGRERGWRVELHHASSSRLFGPGVTFSECRNSDQIVLYPTRWNLMEILPDHGISERAWAGKKFVSPTRDDCFERAAVEAETILLRQLDEIGKAKDFEALAASWK